MKKVFLSLALTIAILNSISCYAQDLKHTGLSKNVVHGSIGTFIFLNSTHISYDILLTAQDKGFFKAYYATVRAGGNITLGLNPITSFYNFIASAGITGLTGREKHHFELGLGIGIANKTVINSD